MAAVGLFIAWPGLIPAMLGATKQKQFPERALSLIERSVISMPSMPQG